MADIKIFNPAELNKPRSPYMQVALVKTSQLAFIAGQVSIDASGALIGQDDFDAQCDQVFANIHAALRSVGADWKNVVEFTSYLVRPQDAARLRRLSPTGLHSHVSGRRVPAEYVAGDRAPRARIPTCWKSRQSPHCNVRLRSPYRSMRHQPCVLGRSLSSLPRSW